MTGGKFQNVKKFGKLRPVSQSSYVWSVPLEDFLSADCVQELRIGVSRLRAIRLCTHMGVQSFTKRMILCEEEKKIGKKHTCRQTSGVTLTAL